MSLIGLSNSRQDYVKNTPKKMTLAYRKNKNALLFRDLERVGVFNAQNYIPLYTRFFTLNATNWSSVNLDNSDELVAVHEGDGGKFQCAVRDALGDRQTDVFFKMCPLIDPAKYLTGVYATQDLSLPTFTGDCYPKMNDKNNSAYVDSFFYYLTSRLRHAGFVHGIDFYGSYLGLKRDFRYNLEDDSSYCMNCTFFEKNNNILFSVNTETPSREKLAFGDDVPLEFDELEIDNSCNNIGPEENELNEIELHAPTDSLKLRSQSLCSSDSSNTDDTEDMTENMSHEESNGDELIATIVNFPVQVVAMESCVNTLDSLLRTLRPEELTSALMQVIMTLAAYNRIFQFTHNDLHTNNIMFVLTDNPYLYYFYNGTSYRVPTFGKIYKLIDFGRSIYTFSDRRFVSDSFAPDGDAASQYNIEPFMNANKPVLDANYSFDLCRLACSMLDVLPETDEFEPLRKLVDEWCLDDKGRNVVYKQNGDERYPCFKLYKMIARTVHQHTAEAQLRRTIFQQYVVKKKSVKNNIVMNLDTLAI